MRRRGPSARIVRSRMAALLAEIARAYDFGHFTMPGFAHWLERRRGRRIEFIAWPMPSFASGACFIEERCDYVFYERDTLPVHQAHIQLHEMAHLLCGHPAIPLDLRQLKNSSQVCQPLLLRSVRPSHIELEAETLTLLIQERVLRHARLQELTAAILPAADFSEYLASYIRTVEFDA